MPPYNVAQLDRLEKLLRRKIILTIALAITAFFGPMLVCYMVFVLLVLRGGLGLEVEDWIVITACTILAIYFFVQRQRLLHEIKTVKKQLRKKQIHISSPNRDDDIR